MNKESLEFIENIDKFKDKLSKDDVIDILKVFVEVSDSLAQGKALDRDKFSGKVIRILDGAFERAK